MAPSPLRLKTRQHARSNSLPSKSHSLVPQFDECLSKLNASEASSTSSLSSMSDRFVGLRNIYDCVDDLLVLPHIQQSISQDCQEKCVDEMLDGYVRLLDACSTTKDLFAQIRQDMQDLLSILRRRRDSDDLSVYLTSRKNLMKAIKKSLKAMRSNRNSEALEQDEKTMAAINTLKEVESVTLAMFESLMSYVIGTKGQSKQGAWSRASSLISKKVSSHEDLNEFEKVDVALQALISKQIEMQIEEVQSLLGEIESNAQILEEELELLFRRLIKTRVSLLNILNH